MHAEEAGNAYLHTFNREHLAAPAVELLIDVRLELERRLREFSSSAPKSSRLRTRAGASNSLAFPTTSSRGPATTLLSGVSEADIRRLRRERPPIVDELDHDAITIAGPEPAELLGARR